MTGQLLEILEPGDTFIDLGANEGWFSILASKKVGNEGKVLCIEPQQRLWEIISMNISLNNCFNIQLYPMAVGEKSEEEIQMTLSPTLNTGSSSLVKNQRSSFWKQQTVKSVSLDNLVKSAGLTRRIKLVKIDIEGFEFFALKGAKNLLQNRQIGNFLIELHPAQLESLGQSVEQIHSYLSNFGFQESNGVFRLQEQQTGNGTH
jgi:FkbM family methyltransferase